MPLILGASAKSTFNRQQISISLLSTQSRKYTVDGRQRLSSYWIPSTRGSNADPKQDDAHVLLSKAGFIQQAYSGVFQLLPLGLRVQEKVEKLIDQHMRSLGASKLSLSSLSSEGLWRRSGRLSESSELLKVRTRAKDAFLLSPTHEEEITKLVANAVTSPKDVPLRLYQITRKYRDELRPRQGLLRTREFSMKDLYTFDLDDAAAADTYDAVKAAYTSIFDAFKIPFLVADADSGNMGGNLSHEFHFASPAGEDTVFSCGNCDYVANEELVSAYRPPSPENAAAPLVSWYGLQNDGRTLVIVYYRSSHRKRHKEGEINLHALKKVIPDLDAGVERPLEKWLNNARAAAFKDSSEAGPKDKDAGAFRIFPLYDMNSVRELPEVSPNLPFQKQLQQLQEEARIVNKNKKFGVEVIDPPLSCSVDLMRVRDGDHCPKCHTGTLESTQAIELGHTFHLGTRYSVPLEAQVNMPGGRMPMPLTMGCHGIGISRMIGAMATILKDEIGLNWPKICAPFEVVLIPGAKADGGDLQEVYDMLGREGTGIDTVIDDRDGSLVQKLKDADLIGYPIIVALGRDWQTERKCEVQCRRLSLKESVPVQDLEAKVVDILGQL